MIFCIQNISPYLYTMKSAKVLKILHISCQILAQRVKNKEIQVIELPNSFYDYNGDDIYHKDS